MEKNKDMALLVLRLSFGLLMLLYGIDKLINGIDFIKGLMTGRGWPVFIAYGVYLGEVGAPLLIMAGFRTRLAGLVFAVNCLVAVLLTQPSSLVSLNGSGGWAADLLMMYALGGVVLFLSGAGRFAVSYAGKWD